MARAYESIVGAYAEKIYLLGQQIAIATAEGISIMIPMGI